jgi:hypothetical protein
VLLIQLPLILRQQFKLKLGAVEEVVRQVLLEVQVVVLLQPLLLLQEQLTDYLPEDLDLLVDQELAAVAEQHRVSF